MKVMVTGGAGYIGAHLLVELLSAGHDAVVLDNFDNGHPVALARAAELAGTALPTVVEADLTDADAARDAVLQHRPDAVIHLAGLKAVGESVEDPLRYYRVNVAGAVNLMAAMEAAGTGRILFSSTATVYGTPRYLPYDEDHPLAPESPYAASKAMVERILSDWTAAGPGRRAVSLRYFNPVGAHPSGRIGEDPRGVPANLMPFLSQVATGRRGALRIWGDDYDTPDGTGVRDYIHVVDLARAHLAALERLGAEASEDRPPAFETFNIGTGRGTSVREMHAAFERAVGRSLPAEVHPRRAGDVAAMEASCARAAEILGWRAELGLDAMVRDLWAWARTNPGGYGRND